MLYVDAVVPDTGELPEDAYLARPTTVMWMSDAAYARAAEADRAAWREAAKRTRAKVVGLFETWGEPFEPWYADNSREGPRDETFRRWLPYGAIRKDPGIVTTSSKGRYALTESFADLFDPALADDARDAAIEAWRSNHMDPLDLLRIRAARDRDQQRHAVVVTLPDGSSRSLEPGDASMILKGVVEEWATARLTDPVVLTISEPGRKILLADAATLNDIGLMLDMASLLPDALIVDLGETPPTFWLIEAVASDGPIDEGRKHAFLSWADDQRIPPGSCRFLTAFRSRHSASARKRFKDLAVGTYAWYADEPQRELSWYEIRADN